MKIPTTGQNSGQLFCLQRRIVDATKYGDTEKWGDAKNYCGGEPEWKFNSCDWILYRSNNGEIFKALADELHKTWSQTGIQAFYKRESAFAAKSIMKNADQNGEFDHCDGYKTLLYRVRSEYRIVSVEFDIKTTVC